MRVGILGAGKVGATLGLGWRAAGHEITFGARDPEAEKHAPLKAGGAGVAGLREAAVWADVVVLATPWGAAEAALTAAGPFDGKPLLDATNPLEGGLKLGRGHTDSGGEQIQRWAPTAQVVKAFNTTGVENMADPDYGVARATLFVCGDDASAVQVAERLAADLGFDPVNAGALSKARLLEPLALLWIELAMVRGHGRGIALSLLRRG